MIEVNEELAVWATFPGEFLNEYEGSKRNFWMRFYGIQRKGETKEWVAFGEVRRYQTSVGIPDEDDGDLVLQADILARGIRRLEDGTNTESDIGQGKLLRNSKTTVKYVADCGQEYQFKLNDLVLLAELIEEGG